MINISVCLNMNRVECALQLCVNIPIRIFTIHPCFVVSARVVKILASDAGGTPAWKMAGNAFEIIVFYVLCYFCFQPI